MLAATRRISDPKTEPGRESSPAPTRALDACAKGYGKSRPMAASICARALR